LSRARGTDYRIPGPILGGVYDMALAAALIQIGWIAAQVRIIGRRSFLQPLFGAVGAIDLALAWRLRAARP
jgi:hypothetical protein